MSLIVSSKGGGSYTPLEPGTYPARCVGLIDLGLVHNETFGKDQLKVRIVWELPTERVNNEAGDDKPRWMSKQYTANLSEKSNLRKDLDAWRGRPFTPEELDRFDLSNIINAPCLLTIVSREGSNGNIYSNVGGVAKVMKGMTVAELENPAFQFDMDAPLSQCESVKATLPEWMQKEIEGSITWQEKIAGSGGDVEGSYDSSKLGDMDDDDGDIPF